MSKEPTDHVYVVLQDHGPDQGGWGIAAWALLPGIKEPQPAVYGGSNPKAIEALEKMAKLLSVATKKPTIFAKFTHREDIATFT